MRGQAWLAFAMGIAGLVFGISIRFGITRYWIRWYEDEHLPFYARNLAFIQVPVGVAFLLVGFSFIAFEAHGDVRLLAPAFISCSCIMGLLALRISYRPPRWVKPQWLREREGPRSGELPNHKFSQDRFMLYFMTAILSLGAIATASVTVVGLITD